MAISELVGLVKVLRDLAARKAELKKEYFKNFIQPAWDTFVQIHEDYKAAFTEYAGRAARRDFRVEDLVEKIRQDSIRTADLRAELKELIGHLPSGHPWARNDYVSEFMASVVGYFDTRDGLRLKDLVVDSGVEVYYDGSPEDNSHFRYTVANLRYPLIIYLSRKGSNMATRDLSFYLWALMRLVQRRYEIAARSYHRLRSVLLT